MLGIVECIGTPIIFHQEFCVWICKAKTARLAKCMAAPHPAVDMIVERQTRFCGGLQCRMIDMAHRNIDANARYL